MEATLVEKKAVSATVKVSVTASEVDATFERVLGALSRQVRVPGFRPGKAPRGVLIGRVGEDALGEEVRDALVDAHYPKAVQQLELTPVHAHFHAESPQQGNDFEFEVHVDLYPEFELPDLDEIVIDTETPVVSDEMVADAVQQLQRENATLIPVDRPAEPGDHLLLEMVGADGEASGTLPIDLETAQEHLAAQLIGTSIGDTVALVLSPPADADATEDASSEDADTDDADTDDADTDDAGTDDAGTDDAEGEDVEADTPAPLEVRVSDIRAKERPEADDEFAKTLGFEAWSEAEERIRDSLAGQLEQQAFDEQVDEFVEKLLAETSFELPAILVNRRKLELLENLVGDLQQRDLSLDGYLASLDESGERERFDAEHEESAANGVRRDLVLERLLEQRGTRLTDDEFNGAVRQMATREGMDPQRFRRDRGERWLANYRFLLTRDRALRETVRERLGGADDSEVAGPDAAEEATDGA